MFETVFSGPKPPVFQGREFPFTVPPQNLVHATISVGGGQLPPALPAVRPEFPVDARAPGINQLIAYEPAWGIAFTGIWDGMPLQFFPSLQAYQTVDATWFPVHNFPTPNIARGNPQPLSYTLG
jgi:hypothetical protein